MDENAFWLRKPQRPQRQRDTNKKPKEKHTKPKRKKDARFRLESNGPNINDKITQTSQTPQRQKKHNTLQHKVANPSSKLQLAREMQHCVKFIL